MQEKPTKDLESTIRWKKARCGEVYNVLKTILSATIKNQTSEFTEVIEGLDHSYKCFEALLISEEVLNFEEEWHKGESKIPLHEFLGWNREQYARYVESGKTPYEP